MYAYFLLKPLCLCCTFVPFILSPLYLTGHHECEILHGGHEAAESEYLWRECKKNPGHEEFISAKDFKDNYLTRVHTDTHRNVLRAMIDLTVRLRVNWTSPERPDDDPLSNLRGMNKSRSGTGFIKLAFDPVSDKPCPCVTCNGVVTRKFWKFCVRTAKHVVCNTEEAKSTFVDLFYDDDSCRFDGRMETVTGLKVEESIYENDISYMMCVTCDEAVGEKIKSAWSCWRDERNETLDLSGLDFLQSCDGGRYPSLIVSHPHGKPKKITIGKGINLDFPRVCYNTATCPGSSGATAFWFQIKPYDMRYSLEFTPVHSGTFYTTCTQHKDQLNLLTRIVQKLRMNKTHETELVQLNYGHEWLFSPLENGTIY